MAQGLGPFKGTGRSRRIGFECKDRGARNWRVKAEARLYKGEPGWELCWQVQISSPEDSFKSCKPYLCQMYNYTQPVIFTRLVTPKYKNSFVKSRYNVNQSISFSEFQHRVNAKVIPEAAPADSFLYQSALRKEF